MSTHPLERPLTAALIVAGELFKLPECSESWLSWPSSCSLGALSRCTGPSPSCGWLLSAFPTAQVIVGSVEAAIFAMEATRRCTRTASPIDAPDARRTTPRSASAGRTYRIAFLCAHLLVLSDFASQCCVCQVVWSRVLRCAGEIAQTQFLSGQLPSIVCVWHVGSFECAPNAPRGARG